MNRRAVITLVGMSLIVCPTYLWAAQDGATLYKTKCSSCHNANGEGKPAMKAPALKGTKMDAAEIAQYCTKGKPDGRPPHNKGISGLTDEQAKTIAEFVKAIK